MASFTVASTEVGVRAKTLTASTVDTVTFSSDLDSVEVLSHDGAAELYVTVDGSVPTVAGQNTYVLPAAPGSLEVVVPTPGLTVVRLISAGTPKYSVTAGP